MTTCTSVRAHEPIRVQLSECYHSTLFPFLPFSKFTQCTESVLTDYGKCELFVAFDGATAERCTDKQSVSHLRCGDLRVCKIETHGITCICP
jgi:hypothetical protein